MEVLRLGVESDTQLLAYTTDTAMQDPSNVCNLHHSSQKQWIHWARPGIEPTFSWILGRFISVAPQWELLKISSYDPFFLVILEAWGNKINLLVVKNWKAAVFKVFLRHLLLLESCAAHKAYTLETYCFLCSMSGNVF